MLIERHQRSILRGLLLRRLMYSVSIQHLPVHCDDDDDDDDYYYLRQVNEVNGGDNAFVCVCLSVCVCVCARAQQTVMGVK